LEHKEHERHWQEPKDVERHGILQRNAGNDFASPERPYVLSDWDGLEGPRKTHHDILPT